MAGELGKYFRISLALLAVLAPLTWEAIRCYPKFDDACLELIIKENGSSAVTAAQTNRPVVGWIIQKAVTSSFHRPLGAGLQFAGWALFGVVSLLLWIELFPEKRQYAPLAAVLTIAPLLIKGQLGMWFFVVPVNLSVIPAYGAGMMLWRYVQRGSQLPSLYIGVAATLTFAGVMVSEYGLLATIALCILLLSLAWPADRLVRVRLGQSLATLTIASLGAHWLYVHTADAHPTYGGVSFTPPISEVISHASLYAVRLVSAFWYSTIGAYAQAIGVTAAQKANQSGFLVSVLYAAFVGTALAVACRRDSGDSVTAPRSYSWLRIVALALAVCASLAPAFLFSPLFVGRDLHMEEMSTRYYFVAAPLVVVLTLRALLAVTRERWWPLLPVLCGFLAGDAVILHMRSAARNNTIMHAMGPILEPYVRSSTDQTVVLVPDFYGRDLEMTSKASSEWPAELSRRLWIMWDVRQQVVLGGKPAGRASSCQDIQSIDRNLDTVVRRGKIAHLLWLEPLPQGGFRVEPYCLDSRS